MAGTDSKVVKFNAGEALSVDDLNNVVAGATQRAWEWPEYGSLFPQAQMVTSGYGAMFNSATDLNKTVFTKGGGLRPFNVGTDSGLESGFLGVYSGTAAPAVLTPKMRWIWLDDLAVTLSHTPEAGGTARWDLVVVTFAEVDSDSVNRGFRDSITGQLTTQNMATRKALQATFSIRPGTPGAGIPSPIAGEYAVYAARLPAGGGAIDEFADLTMPLGSVDVASPIPSQSCSIQAGWETIGWVLGTATFGGTYGTGRLYCPVRDATARLLGIKVSYKLLAGATVKLLRQASYLTIGPSTDVELANLTSFFTADNTQRTVTIDLRGKPWSGYDVGPLWGSATTRKVVAQEATLNFLALDVGNVSAAGNALYGVDWIFARS